MELEERDDQIASLKAEVADEKAQTKFLNKKMQEMSEAFTFKSNGQRYHLMSGQLSSDGVQRIKQGCSDSAEEIVVSILEEEEMPALYEMLHVPDLVAEAWQRAASKNHGGGVGQILEVKNFEGTTMRKQMIVQPCYNLGNLWNYLLKGNAFSWQERCVLFQDLFNGYLALHAEGLIQGDPKWQNMLLDDQKGLHLFVGDTNLACFGNPETTLDKIDGYNEKKNILGTPSCWAPELFFEEDGLDQVDRYKAEVWGVGMIAALFLLKDNASIISKVLRPFKNANLSRGELEHPDLKAKFKKKNGCVDFKKICTRFTKWLAWKDAEMADPALQPLQSILEKMFEPDPTKRPMLQELKSEVDAAMKTLLG